MKSLLLATVTVIFFSSAFVSAQSTDSLSDWETYLPHSTQASVNIVERALLKKYLDKPSDRSILQILAADHLAKMHIFSRPSTRHLAFRHAILAKYFLSRLEETHGKKMSVSRALSEVQKEIDRVMKKSDALSNEENHPAHHFFNQTFNYNEGDRYQAEIRLLEDFVAHPNNVYTSFLLNATHLWTGGEGDYDDPTVLYNFVLGSYFSIHTMGLAKTLEEKWQQNPQAYTRFRMASILGGFSALHRRWLATAHNDTTAVALIDDEHRKWRLIHRSFHAFTLGLPFFEESENFLEGMFAYGDAVAHCQEVPVRTCSNLPRFSHNFTGFMLGYVDFLLKAGDTQTAGFLLSWRHNPQLPVNQYPFWDLGKVQWEHRENNLEAIAALYQNDNPSDDPINLLMKKRKWGSNTTTCQVCHQAQSSYWTDEEKATIVLPPEAVASVGTWPQVSTSWYGSSK
jgi:hypothetical protein